MTAVRDTPAVLEIWTNSEAFADLGPRFYGTLIILFPYTECREKPSKIGVFQRPRRPAARPVPRLALWSFGQSDPAMSKLTLTPEMLESAYEYLRVSPPFCHWDLPHADHVSFRVLRAKD